MVYVKQYLPSFFDPINIERTQHVFKSQEELLEIPFIKSWGDRYNYALTKEEPSKLMAVSDDGYTWYVIGFIDDITGLDLPEWKPKWKEQEES